MRTEKFIPLAKGTDDYFSNLAFNSPSEEAKICLECPLNKCPYDCKRYKTMHDEIKKRKSVDKK